jgi:decaprenyl-phosphate phosphoribosyltransferase
MLPGAAMALVLADEALAPELVHLLLGVVSTCLIVSANYYTINERLDAEFDRHHPVKQHLPSRWFDTGSREAWRRPRCSSS